MQEWQLMGKSKKALYSILLGGVLWALVQALFLFGIAPFSNHYTEFLVYCFMYIVLGAALFITIKAVYYIDLIYLVASIAMYQLLNFINAIVHFIFVSESQFNLPSNLISGTLIVSALMYLFGASSGAITIMLNKRVLDKSMNKEALEEEKDRRGSTE